MRRGQGHARDPLPSLQDLKVLPNTNLGTIIGFAAQMDATEADYAVRCSRGRCLVPHAP